MTEVDLDRVGLRWPRRACALALLAALVAAVWALRGMAQRAEAVLAIVEQELRPVIGQAVALTEDGLTILGKGQQVPS